jgi:hypothetical protein
MIYPGSAFRPLIPLVFQIIAELSLNFQRSAAQYRLDIGSWVGDTATSSDKSKSRSDLGGANTGLDVPQ